MLEDIPLTDFSDPLRIDASIPAADQALFSPTRFSARLIASMSTGLASRKSDMELTHSINPDDTVDSIAIKYGVQPSDLKRINKIYDPSHIILRSSVVIPKKSSSASTKPRLASSSALLTRLEDDVPAISETLESMDVAATLSTCRTYQQLESLKPLTLIDSPTCRVVFRPNINSLTELTIELTPLVHLLPPHEQKRQVERVREYIRNARDACEARQSKTTNWTFWSQKPVWVGLVKVADAETSSSWPPF
ncbi:hypothetical protein SmJEL517_g04407 [Synchytrium microbalum]|uniref:LysM domain-containing protein n=1 Tax=Synchytrium microbalum TaxID=1806994 RepID=A0A507C3G9_9FUNG|nr:uncharacterized protein SmJEL517_g04407 [Synchytrium microbalum]TPX32496.1 hypothetical protein SmJEL517_g04407 [Synchytrium microbalum]